ncbi:MAG: adenylosuccinate synthetase, partial [Candidatus Thermoplasmatota archaeon]|nr:adenylosuccinate synthetase [Candidatus Thermoplasmatota archaeon]
GIRMHHLLELDSLAERLQQVLGERNFLLRELYSWETIDPEEAYAKLHEWGERLAPYVADTGVRIDNALRAGQTVLLEGAQGTLLDIDHGTYPFVTSSNTVSGNAAAGSGIPATAIDDIFGVTKAYTTRVGEGPFPTELFGELNKCIAEKGGEFGTTTGRNRRCGWLDLVVLRHAHALNGFTGLALTKIDILGGFDELKICTHYTLDGRKTTRFPADLRRLKRCEPKYQVLEGWNDIEPKRMSEILREGFSTLPSNMRKYIRFVERETGVRVVLLGLGRRRSETLDLRKRRW